jgi:hypothetical protein
VSARTATVHVELSARTTRGPEPCRPARQTVAATFDGATHPAVGELVGDPSVGQPRPGLQVDVLEQAGGDVMTSASGAVQLTGLTVALTAGRAFCASSLPPIRRQ